MATSKDQAPSLAVPPSAEAVAIESFESFLGASADVVEAFGMVVGTAGRLEKVTGVKMEDMAKAFMDTDLGKFLEGLGPELAPLFVKISLRTGALGRLDIDKLTPDEKIEFREKMKELANDMRKLLEGLHALFAKRGR